MSDHYEVRAVVDDRDQVLGLYDAVDAREDGISLYRDGESCGFVSYEREPVVLPFGDVDV